MTFFKWNESAFRNPINIAGAACAALWLALSPAAAVDNYTGAQTCTTDLCSALTVQTTLNNLTLGATDYAGEWAEKFWSPGGTCMRIEVTWANGADVEMNVVAPSGTHYRDDDSGAGDLPRVEIPTTQPGYYTVVVHSYNGSGTVATDMAIQYANYNSGNMNCANPTPSL